MKHNAYTRLIKEDFTLRDYLAIDRTVLANERTFLAYINSALAMVLTGISFIKFFSSFALTVFGGLCIGTAAAIAIVGAVTYVEGRRKYDALIERQKAGE
ncbi:MAG: DUF202 domain-containing protein [Bdellovibrionales bacterium]|nr:DUF202 domain-containing protein [Bdellovibrionales bacterium]